MAQKTAVDILIQELCMNNMVQLNFSQWNDFGRICDKAKRSEQNQIQDAIIDCYNHIASFNDGHIPMMFTPEEYYNMNYKEIINESTE
jgi:hypothetical protein